MSLLADCAERVVGRKGDRDKSFARKHTLPCFARVTDEVDGFDEDAGFLRSFGVNVENDVVVVGRVDITVVVDDGSIVDVRARLL